MSKRRLASNVAVRFLVTAVEKLAALVLLPLLVAGLGVEGYGYLALVMSVGLVFSNVLTLRLPIAVIRFYPGRSGAGPVVLVGLLYCGVLSILCFGLYQVWGERLAFYLFDSKTKLDLLAYAMALGLSAMLYEFVTITFRAESEFRFLSLVDMAERVAYVGLCVFLLWSGRASVEVVCTVLLCTTFGKLAVVAIPALKGIRWSWPDQKLATKMFLFSLPFLPYLGSAWLLERGSFFVLAKLGGPAQVGAFAIAFSVAAVLGSAMGPLQTVLYPLVRIAYDAGDLAHGRELLVTALRFILCVGAFGTISMCLGIHQLFAILSIRSAPPDWILLAGLGGAIIVGLLRHLFVTVLNLEMNTKMLAITAPVVAVLSLPVYYVFIRLLGETGAALAFLAGTALHTFILGRCVPASLLPIPSRQFCLALLAASLMAAAIQWAFNKQGAWQYLLGLSASGACFLGASYCLGALAPDEKLKISQWLRDLKVSSVNLARKVNCRGRNI